MTQEIWNVTRDTWHVTFDMWHKAGGRRWNFSPNFSFLALTVKCDMWQLTCDIWNLTYDIRHTTHRGWYILCQHFGSLALGYNFTANSSRYPLLLNWLSDKIAHIIARCWVFQKVDFLAWANLYLKNFAQENTQKKIYLYIYMV